MADTALPFPHQEEPQPPLFLYSRDGHPVPEQTLPDAPVAYTVLTSSRGEQIRVSTAFLGVDASLGTAPVPLIFETLTAGGPLDATVMRAGDEGAALWLHQQAVRITLEARDRGVALPVASPYLAGAFHA